MSRLSLPVPGAVANPLGRLASTAANVLEVARFGGLRTDDRASPYTVAGEGKVYRLRRYFPDSPATGERPTLLLVPPLMLTAEVWDVSPETSAVALLDAHDVDPWVIDFGDPAREPGGGQRDVTDHVLGLVEAIDQVRAATGHDIHIGGYSQGGLFCYQAAAVRQSEGVSSIVALGSPVTGPDASTFGVPDELFSQLQRLSGHVLGRTGVPGWAVSRGFRLANPLPAARHQAAFLLALHDREALLPRERQRRFIMREGWVSYPGPALEELLEIMADERYLKGGLVFGERTVSLADVTCPILIFVGERDEFGPPPGVRAIAVAAPHAEVYERVLPVGHFGLGVGSQATEHTWPGVADWIRWRDDDGPSPPQLTPLDPDTVTVNDEPGHSGSLVQQLRFGAGRTAWAGVWASQTALESASRTVTTVGVLAREAVAQAPRLMRLERMAPGTRVSYGLLLDEAAHSRPDDINFLFEGRGYTHQAAKQRIDNVVRGLIALGVHRGDHVGVLMATRPSTLTATAALNRLGAVAVLLRPGESTAREVKLGRVRRVIADPEHAAAASAAAPEVLVLGGGGEPRELGGDVIDMERIDPDEVALPGWYRPNPGRARDLAFILFSGTGARTRASRITNGRWALSAFGAASAASLTRADTVYAVSPLHHPSGLLLATAGPAAGGARLAMAPQFDSKTFWPEVRRYGATVVPYTWTMLRALLDAPPNPDESHHPIRLFVGSGMPPSLWRRVLERFAPAHVLEMYASTRSGAILANVSGRKIGAMGRPLPGTPRVRVVRYDLEARRLVTGDDGFAIPCPPGETGMLLVEVDPVTDLGEETVSRGVFSHDDAWTATGDLFRRDEDGDLWLVDRAEALIKTKHGTVSPREVEGALGTLDAVDLAACYRHTRPRGGNQAIAAVRLRPERELDARTLTRALGTLDPSARPDIVQVVEEMPLTSWFRPALAEHSRRNQSSRTVTRARGRSARAAGPTPPRADPASRCILRVRAAVPIGFPDMSAPARSLVASHPAVSPLLDGRGGPQRARLLEAMTQVVADKGYLAATVSDVVAAARVSRSTFYALFESKEACFLEAYRLGTEVLNQRSDEAALTAEGDARERLRAAQREYAVTLAAEPRYARSYLVEITTAGPAALAARDAELVRLGGRLRRSFEAIRREEPELVMPSDDALFVVVAGIDQLAAVWVRGGRIADLPELADELTTIALAVLEGTT